MGDVENDLVILREASKQLYSVNLQLALKTIKISSSLDRKCQRTKKIYNEIYTEFERRKSNLIERILKTIKNEDHFFCKKKVIWFFWAQGYNDAPNIVKVAYETWVKNNSGYEVIFLDNGKISELLGFDLDELVYINENINMGYAGKSDFLRILLLYKFGGVWVDSTSFCLAPIDHWLDIKKTKFFMFRQSESCKDRCMVSWFMASEKGSELCEKLLMKTFEFLTEKKKKYLITVSNNRIPKPDGSFVSRTGTGYKYLSYCEEHGFIPYFWFFYLWNEVRKDNLYLVSDIESMSNNYSNLNDSRDKFLCSFVSKNTYKITEKNKIELEERIRYVRGN